MLKRIDLHPDKERYKNYSFSTCVVAGDFVFTSHQGGVVDEDGRWLATIEEQTEQSCELPCGRDRREFLSLSLKNVICELIEYGCLLYNRFIFH